MSAQETKFAKELSHRLKDQGGEAAPKDDSVNHPHRPFSETRKAYVRGSGVTASMLYRAIVAHGGPA